MMDNDLIRKTKAGKYYNISFKFDDQTRAGEYGSDFEGKIKLEAFYRLSNREMDTRRMKMNNILTEKEYQHFIMDRLSQDNGYVVRKATS